MAKKSFVPGEVLRAADVNEYLTSSKNVIINGAFEINQRNFTSSTSSVYGFDRWLSSGNTGTVTYSAQAFSPGSGPAGYESANFARIVTSGQSGADAIASLNQGIENVRTFAGETVTLSFFAKAASGTPKLAGFFQQFFGSGGSPSASVNIPAGNVTLSTSWQRYSLTVDIPSIAGKTLGTTINNGLYLQLWVSGGSNFDSRTGGIGIQSNTFDIWGVQVEEGSTATPFSRNANSIAGELAACQRYYYRTQSGSTFTIHGYGQSGNATTASIPINLPVSMRISPTSVDWSTLQISDLVNYSFTVSDVGLSVASTNTVSLFVTHSSGATAQRGAFLRNANSVAGYVGFSAEL